MNMEALTPEMIAKAKEATTPEELLTLAAQAGITLSAEEAAQAFAQLHKAGDLSEDELENVSGGLRKWPTKDIPLKKR